MDIEINQKLADWIRLQHEHIITEIDEKLFEELDFDLNRLDDNDLLEFFSLVNTTLVICNFILVFNNKLKSPRNSILEMIKSLEDSYAVLKELKQFTEYESNINISNGIKSINQTLKELQYLAKHEWIDRSVKEEYDKSKGNYIEDVMFTFDAEYKSKVLKTNSKYMYSCNYNNSITTKINDNYSNLNKARKSARKITHNDCLRISFRKLDQLLNQYNITDKEMIQLFESIFKKEFDKIEKDINVENLLKEASNIRYEEIIIVHNHIAYKLTFDNDNTDKFRSCIIFMNKTLLFTTKNLEEKESILKDHKQLI